ncbi:MFS transporter [Bacillus pseudomycoides]|uniref:MFS transporter n=1 Tax=Bacillus pseudomycoides TaxID=64104 RepID=A0AA91VFE1_9BACI|nr:MULTISPECIES: MFS transporter [Bacillus]PED84332.1 MFS transporter [Bacillus pseudomycoides]PEU08679.1 MFS transporter [Bacillus sp. AFS014408]PEU15859.1 MFS transporter [Bacillus sp. AFS019443]PFW64841.1 MFS transporter [Bacillus sp. AFS075034]
MDLQFKFKLQIDDEHWKCTQEIIAFDEMDAKRRYYRTFKYGFYGMEFDDFIKHVKCENLGLVNFAQLLKKEAQFQRMCKKRRIPFAYIGMDVQVLGRKGKIIGNCKNNLLVLFDGDTEAYNCDPRFEVAYFDQDGQIIKDTRKGVYAV